MDEKSSAVSVLTVSPFESDLILLSNLISHSNWSHCAAKTAAEAREKLRSENVNVVLCDADLPDGNWETVLEIAGSQPTPPEVVVLSRCPDERLWATVLNLGAWDVLTKPILSKEFYRTVHHAFRHWAENAKQRRRGVASEVESRTNVPVRPAVVAAAGR